MLTLNTLLVFGLVLVGSYFYENFKFSNSIITVEGQNVLERPDEKEAGPTEGDKRPVSVPEGVGIKGGGIGGLLPSSVKFTIDVQREDIMVNSRVRYRQQIFCPSGSFAISGGWSASSHIRVFASYMISDEGENRTGWYFKVFNDDTEKANLAIFFVNCARLS